MRLLFVENEPVIARAYVRALSRVTTGWQVIVAPDAERALALLGASAPNAILVDWNLYDRTGVEFCLDVRRIGHNVPLLMLTDRDCIEDRLHALSCGVDDYLIKGAMSIEEVRDRVLVSIRRKTASHPPCGETVFGVTIAYDRPSIWVTGECVDLTHHQWQLLLALSRKRGRVVSHAELCVRAGIQAGTGFYNLRNEIYRLRRRLPANAPKIVTVRGHGYRLAIPDDEALSPPSHEARVGLQRVESAQRRGLSVAAFEVNYGTPG